MPTCHPSIRMRPWSIIPIALQTADKNLLFDAAFSTGNNIDPTLWSIIAEDGKVIELNIVDTDGWTINLLEDGDVAFIIVDAKSKSGMKFWKACYNHQSRKTAARTRH